MKHTWPLYPIGVLTGLVAAMQLCASVAHASDYVSIEGGLPVIWTSTNDQSELEAGNRSDPLDNWRVAATYGHRWRPSMDASWLSMHASIDGRISLGHQSNYVHGRNGSGCNMDSCSADNLSDNTLGVTSLTFEAWPSYGFSNGLRVSAGVGVGPAYATALDDQAWTLLTTAGAELSYELPRNWTVSVGPRLAWAPLDFTLDRQNVEYFTITPVSVRLAWHFN